jgi:choline dehydrogenase-like flavoprotein
MVDGKLKVRGVHRLRIADGSIMPWVTTGNRLASCVVIGERAAEVLRVEHKGSTTRPSCRGHVRQPGRFDDRSRSNISRV